MSNFLIQNVTQVLFSTKKAPEGKSGAEEGEANRGDQAAFP